MLTTLPNYLKRHYSFQCQSFTTREGHKLNYVDEGKGHALLMIHGNPTWSFYYRNLIENFKKDYRVIVPDHIGCGLSDKPQNYRYILENHCSNLKDLFDSLNLKSFSLIVHDWGGPIGLSLAEAYPDRCRKVVLLNTAAFHSTQIPWRIFACKLPHIGEQFIRLTNGFAAPAIHMAVTKKMPREVAKSYLYPYSSYQNRIATARFVRDIPLKENHESFPQLKKIERQLGKLNMPKLILWGGQDFCFNQYYLNRWMHIYPDAKIRLLESAGHYVLEDSPEECLKEIRSFL